MTRRDFEMLLAAGYGNSAAAEDVKVEKTGSHIGNLYPFAQKQADRAPLELSFLRPEYRDLKQWQQRARAKVFEHMFYAPAQVDPQPQLIRRTDRGDYIEESLTFQTTPDLRVPAYFLIPKDVKLPAPGVVALHDHGAFYLWGKEKLLQSEGEHPLLTKFRQDLYGGKSIARELVRQGYAVIAIDMFYWGERRMILDDDPPEFRRRPATMPDRQVEEFDRRAKPGRGPGGADPLHSRHNVARRDAMGRHPHGRLHVHAPGGGHPAPGLCRALRGRLSQLHAGRTG